MMIPLLPVALLLSAALPLSSPPSPAAAAALAEGDAHYARRAEGAKGAVPNPEQVEAAMAAYRRAVVLDPRSLEARAGLLRAIFFRGGFCEITPAYQFKIFEEGKRVAEETVQSLEKSLGSLHGPARIQALRGVPEATAVYFWAAVSWGQWSADHKLAAAWQGAAVRMRDLAQTVVDIDPTMDQGSAYLLLGRLHAECPRIVMITRWISRAQAIVYLRQALSIGPRNTPNMYFLADAILDNDPARADEARQLLEKCASVQPRPEYLVEDAHYAEMARARLASIR
jgi:tetratricopeptide (TPR) repeat protein